MGIEGKSLELGPPPPPPPPKKIAIQKDVRLCVIFRVVKRIKTSVVVGVRVSF